MKVVYPVGGSTLADIKGELARWKTATGALPDTFPVTPGEFRRGLEESRKGKKVNARADVDHFMLQGVEIIPSRGPYYWRARLWVHASIAGNVQNDRKSHQVMSDIAPYISPAVDRATGKRARVMGRAQHRQFLKRNGFVELGNELPRRRIEAMPSVAEDLNRAMTTGITNEVHEAVRRAKKAIPE